MIFLCSKPLLSSLFSCDPTAVWCHEYEWIFKILRINFLIKQHVDNRHLYVAAAHLDYPAEASRILSIRYSLDFPPDHRRTKPRSKSSLACRLHSDWLRKSRLLRHPFSSEVDTNPEGTELIEHVVMPLADAAKMVTTGQITHAPSCVAILLAESIV